MVQLFLPLVPSLKEEILPMSFFSHAILGESQISLPSLMLKPRKTHGKSLCENELVWHLVKFPFLDITGTLLCLEAGGPSHFHCDV